ncbi:MAG: aspartyl protease family protein [Acidobacteria bacterium]|nr:aspartyl protease family protein [Acidobacteriota bacterium]
MDISLVTYKIPITAEGKVMGEVRVKVKLTNSGDAFKARRGELEPDRIRSKEVEAVVDTGAVCTVIPKSLLHELGLELVKERRATYANGESEIVGSSEPVWIELEGRGAFDEALALGEEVLIGQTVLEKTDFLVDCKNKRLVPAHAEGEILHVR